MKEKNYKTITVRRKPGDNISAGLLNCEDWTIPCRLGRSGISSRKKEGDGATPSGRFRLLYGWYRQERIGFVRSPLTLLPITKDDGWCDEPSSPAYNQPVTLPFNQSHEELCRNDRLYDICIVLDYNIHPRARGMGSAIFFHLTSEDLRPTEGCIAIDPEAMRKLLPRLSSTTIMEVID